MAIVKGRQGLGEKGPGPSWAMHYPEPTTIFTVAGEWRLGELLSMEEEAPFGVMNAESGGGVLFSRGWFGLEVMGSQQATGTRGV